MSDTCEAINEGEHSWNLPGSASCRAVREAPKGGKQEAASHWPTPQL